MGEIQKFARQRRTTDIILKLHQFGSRPCEPVTMMRIVAVMLAVVMLTEAAHAQSMGGSGGARRQHQQRSDKSDSQKTKADDKAYNAAIKSLPDKPFDPWHNVR
jgi:hypothetical protein